MPSNRTDQRVDTPWGVDLNGSIMFGIQNLGGVASAAVLGITKHASQTGDALQILASDATKHWFVDASHNTVTYGAQTAPGGTDTNGFLYIPLVTGTAAGGTPANLTGNYANSVPVRFVNNAGTYTWRAYINGGWRSVALT